MHREQADLHAHDPILRCSSLRIDYAAPRGTVRAVNGLDLALQEGCTLGLVGESGSGKSTLAWGILRLVPWPGRILGGQILFRGEDLLAKSETEMRQIRGRKIALITQSARAGLSPLVRIGTQIANVYRAHHNVPAKQARRHVIDMLSAVTLGDPERIAESYLHELSGGMAQRVIIAMALICSPEIVIADEPTTALDLTVQTQILDLIRDIVARRGMSTIIVTHDLAIVAQYCQSLAVMYNGQLLESGPVQRFFKGPVHPYSAALLASASYTSKLVRRATGPVAPTPVRGCSYQNNCPLAQPACRTTDPALRTLQDDYYVRCHRAEELMDSANQSKEPSVQSTGTPVGR
jgi:peptide/nickel transport system ATP-binding protein